MCVSTVCTVIPAVIYPAASTLVLTVVPSDLGPSAVVALLLPSSVTSKSLQFQPDTNFWLSMRQRQLNFFSIDFILCLSDRRNLVSSITFFA
jgi:hypothetical protein